MAQTTFGQIEVACCSVKKEVKRPKTNKARSLKTPANSLMSQHSRGKLVTKCFLQFSVTAIAWVSYIPCDILGTQMNRSTLFKQVEFEISRLIREFPRSFIAFVRRTQMRA